ncbi:hypothetical protein HOLleu_15015 [Holothuria leucospilota]|uniref:Uncharacterized protein n=1 Tax=Holothuria leucospilota TaxID=206669 RepID=A0A9Q1C963_HOLLE|nr:hypothetical protein HOLleu_15015 [Holothuria leucospilota]
MRFQRSTSITQHLSDFYTKGTASKTETCCLQLLCLREYEEAFPRLVSSPLFGHLAKIIPLRPGQLKAPTLASHMGSTLF